MTHDLDVHRQPRDVVVAVRADEAGHRDVNHGFADKLAGRSPKEDACDGPITKRA